MSELVRRPSQKPRVTVVTIFLNGEAFIAEAIESVLAQDFRSFELILVDDGSSDGSTAIARKYAQTYPHIVQYLDHPNHLNRGMSASRNVGLSVARGEYIAFIDADDVWRPQKLGEQVAIMDAHPEVGMLCGTVRYWGSWSGGVDTIIPTGHVQNIVVREPEALLRLYPFGSAAAPCPSDFMVSARVVAQIGGFEESFRGMYEDQAFLAKLYLCTPVLFSDRIWLHYRQHEASCVANAKRDGRYYEIRLFFLMWFSDYLLMQPHIAPEVIRALHRAFMPYRYPILRAAQSIVAIPRRVAAKLSKALR